MELVYITLPNNEEAKSIAKKLIDERLIACANIFPKVTSIYFWGNSINEDSEVVMLAKTIESNLPTVIARVKELHSYENPCIINIPIKAGNV